MKLKYIAIFIFVFLASGITHAQFFNGKASEYELNESYLSGKKDALVDVKNKELQIICFGCTQYPRELFEEAELAAYHISYNDLGDVTPDTLVSYSKGYNEVIKEEMIKRYGVDMVKKFRLE